MRAEPRRAPRRDRRRRVQLPLGAARALRARADRRRGARRAHELPRPLLLDVRQRPARLAVVALPARRGRPRRDADLLSPRRRPRALLLGPITASSARPRRTSPSARSPSAGSHYGRGRAGDPTGAVTNEDYAGMLCEFANGVRGSFEASRTIVGPRARWRSTCTAPRARRAGTSRSQRAAALPRHRRPRLRLHDRARRRALPVARRVRPGSANGIGYEDLVVIEDEAFCRGRGGGRTRPASTTRSRGVGPGGAAASGSGRWEDVVSLGSDDGPTATRHPCGSA